MTSITSIAANRETAGGRGRIRRLLASHAMTMLATAALVSLIATGWVSDRATRTLITAVHALNHTRDVLLGIDQFRASLAAAESNARGYALTGERTFRTQFDPATTRLLSSLTVLEEAVRDEPDGTAVADLRTLVDGRIVLLRQLIETTGRPGNTVRAASVMAGAALTHRIVQRLDALRTEQLRRYEERYSAAEEARRFVAYAPWAMCSFAVMMFVLMLMQASRTFHAEQSLALQLRETIEREHAERERTQAADQMKDQFLAAISHELRAPLTTIIGWCGLLASESSRPLLLGEALKNITDAAHVQSRLVEDLLDISRISAGRLQLCMSETNVVDVIERAVAAVTPVAQEKGLLLRRAYPPKPAVILADAARLQQIAGNLLSNAIKFTPAGGAIDVTVQCVESNVEIIVRDDGEGIEPEVLPHIFDRFRQGKAHAGRHAGLGLGLSIVKNLVELHGGAVTAESAGAGHGATFRVVLPAPQ